MEDLITKFMDVTGVSRERAEFYLASSAGQLEIGLANFFECTESAAAAEGQDPVIEPITEDLHQSKVPSQESPTNTKAPIELTTSMESSKPKEKIKPKARFGTISSLQNRESSSDEEGQAFYAGGSEHSGQQVLGPSKKKNEMINDMFKTCQEQSITPEERSNQRPSTFSGTGYKLGQTVSDTEVIPAAGSRDNQASNNGLITLKLWRDGFTINDREIRSYSDPDNRQFLAAIKRGEIPTEIRQEVQGAEVRLDMEDHRHEEYVPPKPQVKAFTGKGQKLGSPSPATVGMTVTTDPADQAANESLARSQLNLITDNPVTTIQIRLANGQSIREQFNLTHTIGDIRRFITTMRPEYTVHDFNLMTSYPTKELSDENQTVQDAGLNNSAIMQRLK